MVHGKEAEQSRDQRYKQRGQCRGMVKCGNTRTQWAEINGIARGRDAGKMVTRSSRVEWREPSSTYPEKKVTVRRSLACPPADGTCL